MGGLSLKNENGITMVTLVTTIILMIIIVGVVVYNSSSSVDLDSLNRMYDDIQSLQDKLDIYYAENDELPIISELTKTAEDIGITPAVNDGETYYKIDISRLKDLKLNYNNYDYYVNEASHIVYCEKGVEMDGKVYHSLNEDYNAIEDSSALYSLTFKIESSSGNIRDVREVEFNQGDVVNLNDYPVSEYVSDGKGWYNTSECIGNPIESIVMTGNKVVYAYYDR